MKVSHTAIAALLFIAACSPPSPAPPVNSSPARMSAADRMMRVRNIALSTQAPEVTYLTDPAAEPYISKDPVFREAYAEYAKGNRTSARKLFDQASSRGIPGGTYMVGYLYEFGPGDERDLEQSTYYYYQAAQEWHPQAQAAMVVAYYYGHGTSVDYAHALLWAIFAAEQLPEMHEIIPEIRAKITDPYAAFWQDGTVKSWIEDRIRTNGTLYTPDPDPSP